MSKPIIEIKTVEQLHRILLIQRTTSARVSQEISEITKSVTTEANQNDDEYLAEAIMNRERDLLRRYAMMPTLVECQRSQVSLGNALDSALESSSTFAVATIVGECLLPTVAAITPVFPKAHRPLLYLLLKEIEKPSSEDGDLVNTTLRFLKIDLKENDLTEAERQRLLRAMVTPLVEALIMVLSQFELIETVADEGYTITAFGLRVLLHLFAAQTLLGAITEAHPRLQKSFGQRSESPQSAP